MASRRQTLAEATSLLEQLKKANDASTATPILNKLKLIIAGFSWMPAGGKNATSEDAAEMALSREALEQAVLLSARTRDAAGFARNMAQLKPFYTDLRAALGDAAQSSREMLVTGLNLTRLIAAGARAEFHTELERIPNDLQGDRYIKFPVELEQYLEEGCFSKVLAARREVPSECYEPFVVSLADSVRDEMASCSERAYESLSVADAQRFLMFADEASFAAYAAARKWAVRGGRVWFARTDDNANGGAEVASADLMRETVAYAAELDRIV
eukprot:m51a1_g8661 putative 26s proteasome regulatory subunit s14 (271) ;mRNA; f:81304-82366